MGNEQGVPYQQQSASKSQLNSPFDFESLVVVRGEPRTGKSTLVSRMKGQRFDPTYNPTKTLQIYQFPWKLNSSHCNNVMITIWDVAEQNQTQPKNSYCVNNDAVQNSLSMPAQNKQITSSDIDTKRANGLVILIDARKESTVDLADRLICEASEECQIVVFSNFYGEQGVTPVIPKKLSHHIGRFSFIVGNLKTNLGLRKLARWLQLPLLAAKRKMYADLFRVTDNDLHVLEDEFETDCKIYTDLEQAQAKVQQSTKSMVLESYSSYDAAAAAQQATEQQQQTAQPARKPMPFYNNTGNSSNETTNETSTTSTGRKPMPFYNNTGNMNPVIEDNGDDDFWSDDDNSNEIIQTKTETKTFDPNPMVQAAVPKKSFKQIVEENTTKSPEKPTGTQYPVDEPKTTINHEIRQQPTYSTTLVLEEEDEEENNEQQPENITQHISNEQPQIKIEKPTVVDDQNDEEFWSNDNENEPQEDIKPEENEPKTQGNPLVQHIKPKENPYKNIVPSESSTTQSQQVNQPVQSNPLVQKPKVEKTNPYQNVVPTQINTQEQVKETPKANNTNNDDDDFWNFTPTAISPTVVRTTQSQQHQQSTVKRRKVETNDKPKTRPLVIPKSQVQQRTITVSGGNKPTTQTNQNKPTQKVPVIDTVDLFSDMEHSQQNNFFSGSKPRQQLQQPTPQPQQPNKPSSPNNTAGKTVKKRKRIVKSNGGTSSNQSNTSNSNYDTL